MDPTIGGSLVSPTAGGTVNWEPPAYSPDTGLFYVSEKNGCSIFYLTDPDPRGSMGLGGKRRSERRQLRQLSHRDRSAQRQHRLAQRYPSLGGGGGGGGGLLATAGKLVFSGDAGGNIVAYDATNGKPLWHSHIGNVTNAPQTYLLDGRQYLLVATGDRLFSFVMYGP